MRSTKEHSKRDSTSRDRSFYPRDKPQRFTSRVEEIKVQPQPLMDKCNPLCPLFLCGRDALFIANKPIKGRILRVPQCRLTGSDCIGGECQYATCRINSLLPDGKCAKALERKAVRLTDEELFRKIKEFEEYDISDFTR